MVCQVDKWHNVDACRFECIDQSCNVCDIHSRCKFGGKWCNACADRFSNRGLSFLDRSQLELISCSVDDILNRQFLGCKFCNVCDGQFFDIDQFHNDDEIYGPRLGKSGNVCDNSEEDIIRNVCD